MKRIALIFLIAGTHTIQAQEGLLENIQIHGNVDVYAQTYKPDSIISAPVVPQKSGMNSFANFIATKGSFSAGVRIESYMPPVQGFNPNYGLQPVGVPYRYARYAQDRLDITVGNYYEQFGSGMILRSYEERALGLDNALDGVRLKYEPVDGVYIKALIGNQRFYWQKSTGYVRGIDAEWAMNEFIERLESSKLRLRIGGSFVSKYEDSKVTNLELPLNVASWAGRAHINYEGFGLLGEYVYKFNDPNADNHYIYRPGQGVLISATYSRKGFGINLTAKSIDNMHYRSNRDAQLNDLFINYLPALSKQHTYNLITTLYPYATQPAGEIGFQGDIIYKIKKGTALGGKYGTTIQGNVSVINNLDTHRISTTSELDQEVYLAHDPKRQGYKANLWTFGDKIYYRDYNIEIDRKFTKDFKLKTTYAYLEANIDVTQGTALGKNVYAHIAVLDGLYKLGKKHSIRTELQHMWTEQHLGNWAFAMIEYGYSPHWFITILNQYNYGNPIKALQVNYPTAQIAYINKANRISLAYGRQRAGIFCVGGVCRPVPAANGFTLAVTSSF
ncbi:MAG: DUF6029 family protein [Flavobacteriales bacterium]